MIRRRRREANVLVDQHEGKVGVSRALAAQALASAEVGDETVENEFQAKIVAVSRPGPVLRLVAEAVRLPGNREAHLLPAIGCHGLLALHHLPGPVRGETKAHTRAERGDRAASLRNAVDPVEDAVGVEKDCAVEAYGQGDGRRRRTLGIERKLAAL